MRIRTADRDSKITVRPGYDICPSRHMTAGIRSGLIGSRVIGDAGGAACNPVRRNRREARTVGDYYS